MPFCRWRSAMAGRTVPRSAGRRSRLYGVLPCNRQSACEGDDRPGRGRARAIDAHSVCRRAGFARAHAAGEDQSRQLRQHGGAPALARHRALYRRQAFPGVHLERAAARGRAAATRPRCLAAHPPSAVAARDSMRARCRGRGNPAIAPPADRLRTDKEGYSTLRRLLVH